MTVYERVVCASGTRQFDITNSRHEGEHAAKLLSAACGFAVTVTPVVVTMASELTIKSSPTDVAVVGRRIIANWLTNQPSRLLPSQVEGFYMAARQRPNWKS